MFSVFCILYSSFISSSSSTKTPTNIISSIFKQIDVRLAAIFLSAHFIHYNKLCRDAKRWKSITDYPKNNIFGNHGHMRVKSCLKIHNTEMQRLNISKNVGCVTSPRFSFMQVTNAFISNFTNEGRKGTACSVFLMICTSLYFHWFQ